MNQLDTQTITRHFGNQVYLIYQKYFIACDCNTCSEKKQWR